MRTVFLILFFIGCGEQTIDYKAYNQTEDMKNYFSKYYLSDLSEVFKKTNVYIIELDKLKKVCGTLSERIQGCWKQNEIYVKLSDNFCIPLVHEFVHASRNFLYRDPDSAHTSKDFVSLESQFCKTAVVF
jgi:hypothetical protein